MTFCNNYALCEIKGSRLRHPNRAKRRHYPVTAHRFREARFSAGLTVDACADLLQVTSRTMRNWESGATRVPYTAYRLLRALRNGKLLGAEWRGFHVWGGHLVTPEGHRFHVGELSWWSLLVRRAAAFSELIKARDAGASALAARPGTALALGLVPSETKQKEGQQTGANHGSASTGAGQRPAAMGHGCPAPALAVGPALGWPQAALHNSLATRFLFALEGKELPWNQIPFNNRPSGLPESP